MKIYKDGEYAKGKECVGCKTKDGVFYDKASDFFICAKCLNKLQQGEQDGRKQN